MQARRQAAALPRTFGTFADEFIETMTPQWRNDIRARRNPAISSLLEIREMARSQPARSSPDSISTRSRFLAPILKSEALLPMPARDVASYNLPFQRDNRVDFAISDPAQRPSSLFDRRPRTEVGHFEKANSEHVVL